MRKLSNRKLAIAYAVEAVEATRKKKGGCASQMAVSLTNKFRDACQLYISGKRGAPRFKRAGDSISLQYQVQASTPSPIIGDCVRLDKLAGEVCAQVPLILHRPIPLGATIKQVALTIRGPRLFAVLMLDIEGQARPYPMTGRIAGIDPGRKIALSVASLDGQTKEVIQPAISRDYHTLKKLCRLQRKADRQLRAGNPEHFNPDGTFKRVKLPWKRSANLKETAQQILDIQEHIACARADYYHHAANAMLAQYDTIGVGSWRGNGRAPGQGKAKRGQARRDYDHAISSFVSILEYKAEECGKTVIAVPEHGTTVTCSACGQPSGPTGLAGLKVRQWVCSICGTEHDRDFQSAVNIAAAAEKIAAEAQSVSYGHVARIKRHRAKAQTKVQVPVDNEDEAARPSPEILKYRQCCNDEPERKSVAEPNRKMDLSGPSHQSITIDEAQEVGNCDKVRQWNACGAAHDRDFQAAANIAKAAERMAADSAVRVASAVKVREKGRRAQAQTQGTPQGVQIPVADQPESREGRNSNVAKCCERRSDVPEAGAARAAQGPVAERSRETVLSGSTHQPVEKREPLAECKAAGLIQTTYGETVAVTR